MRPANRLPNFNVKPQRTKVTAREAGSGRSRLARNTDGAVPARLGKRGHQRHWFRITGLPGWKRAQLGLPAFRHADCTKARRETPTGATIPRANADCRLGAVWRELRAHMPFTALGTVSGVLLLSVLVWTRAPRSLSTALFWTLHPLHVLLSAWVTTAMFRRHRGHGLWGTVAIGYFGSVGIATLSDCLLPFAGEWLLALPHRGLHLGFIEKWWLVNPLAGVGILIGFLWPHTKFSHAGHVFVSTWASLFHITMALGPVVSLAQGMLIAGFLFLAVWLPCCTSDIVFPLLFTPKTGTRSGAPANASQAQV